MLHVKTPEEVLAVIEERFSQLPDREEWVRLEECPGRVLARDVCAVAYVPDFDRSTVDGYAVRAADTFGCSDAIPAILTMGHEVRMGEGAAFVLQPGECCAVPTGGAVPQGADSVVMVEYTEDYGDGTIGVAKAAAPGQNMIFRGDDVYPGKSVLKKGRVLSAQDVGALAAMGQMEVPVVKRLRVAVISTGDELVLPSEQPGPGQIRDVNGPMLRVMLTQWGAEAVDLGIVPDDEALLSQVMERAAGEWDAVLLSGGTSVGVKDAACRIIQSMGELLFHGIAMKPGKPTILGKVGQVPLVGLPGHPVAAWFITRLFVLPLLGRLMGREDSRHTTTAYLTESIGANHGRAEYVACRLEGRNACPIRGKSGLITTLAGADGYFSIARDCEGLPQGAPVEVTVLN